MSAPSLFAAAVAQARRDLQLVWRRRGDAAPPAPRHRPPRSFSMTTTTSRQLSDIDMSFEYRILRS